MKAEAATSQDADLAVEAPAPCVREPRLDVPDDAVDVLADRAHRPDERCLRRVALHQAGISPSSENAEVRLTESNSALRSRIGPLMQAATVSIRE